MIRPGAVVMTVLMAAVAVGVYFGLDYLPEDLMPGMQNESAEAPQPDAMEAEPQETASAEQTAAEPAAPETVSEDDLAEEPPPGSATGPDAPPPSLAGAVDADPSMEGEAVPIDEPPPEQPAEAAAAPAEEAPAATEEPAPQPEPTQVAKAAPSKPAAAGPPREPVKPPPPASDAIKPWWPDPASVSGNQLKLQYAGQVQNEQAIALLFSAPLDLETLRKHAEVRTAVGETVGRGQWELARNPRMAVLRGVRPGRYTVILQPTVADANGYMLGMTLQGPVYIQRQ